MSGPLSQGSGASLQLKTLEIETAAKRPTFPYFSSGAPLAVEVPEKGIVFANVGGTRRLYTKLDGTIYYVNLT